MFHRDVKPENNLLDAAGNTKVADLGVATDDATRMAHTAQKGTGAYMSPEKFKGDEVYGRQDDMWACGCIFAELLTLEALGAIGSPMRQPHSNQGLVADLVRRSTEVSARAGGIVDELLQRQPELRLPAVQLAARCSGGNGAAKAAPAAAAAAATAIAASAALAVEVQAEAQVQADGKAQAALRQLEARVQRQAQAMALTEAVRQQAFNRMQRNHAEMALQLEGAGRRQRAWSLEAAGGQEQKGVLALTGKEQAKLTDSLAKGLAAGDLDELLDLKAGTAAVFAAAAKGTARAQEQEQRLWEIAAENEKQVRSVGKAVAEAAARTRSAQEAGRRAQAGVQTAERRLAQEQTREAGAAEVARASEAAGAAAAKVRQEADAAAARVAAAERALAQREARLRDEEVAKCAESAKAVQAVAAVSDAMKHSTACGLAEAHERTFAPKRAALAAEREAGLAAVAEVASKEQAAKAREAAAAAAAAEAAEAGKVGGAPAAAAELRAAREQQQAATAMSAACAADEQHAAVEPARYGDVQRALGAEAAAAVQRRGAFAAAQTLQQVQAADAAVAAAEGRLPALQFVCTAGAAYERAMAEKAAYERRAAEATAEGRAQKAAAALLAAAKQGLLNRKGTVFPYNWSVRRYVLTDEYLERFDPKSGQSKGKLLFAAGCSVCTAVKPANSFIVRCGGKEDLLQAASAAECAEWVEEFMRRGCTGTTHPHHFIHRQRITTQPPDDPLVPSTSH
jgi:hypothetical protein